MANIKSAKKRILVNRANADRNKAIRSEVKTAIKKVNAAVEAGNKEDAVNAFNTCNSLLDKAQADNLKSKNFVARQKSRLAKAVASL